MTDSPVSTPSRTILVFVLSSAFLSAMGFGLVGPVLPFVVGRFVTDPGALAATVSALAAVYALCAFFAAPVLGALSDRHGRRPVLLVSLAGSALGYLVFGLAGALPLLFLGRILDGLTAGNFAAFFGMLADRTTPAQRGKVFGQVGAAIGGGFILGPAIGAFAAQVSLETPLFLAAGLCVLNLLWGLLCVPETHPLEQRTPSIEFAQLNPFRQIISLLALQDLRPLLLSSVLFMVPFSMMQGLLGVLLKSTLGWGPEHTSAVFVVVGLSDIVVQGVLLGWLIGRFGELRVARSALGLGVLGLIGQGLLGVLPSGVLVYAAVLAFAIGEGVFTATLNALLSRAAGERQGQVQGGGQSLSAAAQVAGPLLGGLLSRGAGQVTPFYVGAGLVVLAGLALRGAKSTGTPQGALERSG